MIFYRKTKSPVAIRDISIRTYELLLNESCSKSAGYLYVCMLTFSLLNASNLVSGLSSKLNSTMDLLLGRAADLKIDPGSANLEFQGKNSIDIDEKKAVPMSKNQ